MVLWKSPHPDMEIPTDLTTWQWAFEHPSHSPIASPSPGAYIDALNPASRLSFTEVKQLATNLSNALVKTYKLRSGDTVSLFATNSIYYPVAMWAALRVGGRVNGASPAYGVDEMVHAMRTAGSRIVFTLPSCLEVAVEAAGVLGLGRERIVLLEGSVDGVRSLGELIEEGRRLGEVPVEGIPAGKDNRDVCGSSPSLSYSFDRKGNFNDVIPLLTRTLLPGYLNFSSGTTGLPKAVMLSHHNIIAQCHQLRQLQVVTPGDRYRILAVMPLFHITGLVRFCTYPLLMNGDCFMMTKFDLEAMMQAVIKHKIEELILVPPILIRLVKDPVAARYIPDLQRTVKRWSSGSAPISPEIIALLQKNFPATGFRQGYGATESTACISAHPPSHYDYKFAATAGKLVANTVLKVIPLDGSQRELGANEVGELCAKGPQIAMGYLDNAKSTAETFKNGFFHTGDVGYVDDEGLLHIEDRIKEMIKVKGQQVAPAELEDLLLGHGDVEDVAVLGVPDDYSGERPKAVVVLKSGVTPSEELASELMAFVKARKVRYKWVVELEFQNSIPKSPTGKLLRRVLKAAEMETGRVKGVRFREPERAKL